MIITLPLNCGTGFSWKVFQTFSPTVFRIIHLNFSSSLYFHTSCRHVFAFQLNSFIYSFCFCARGKAFPRLMMLRCQSVPLYSDQSNAWFMNPKRSTSFRKLQHQNCHFSIFHLSFHNGHCPIVAGDLSSQNFLFVWDSNPPGISPSGRTFSFVFLLLLKSNHYL